MLKGSGFGTVYLLIIINVHLFVSKAMRNFSPFFSRHTLPINDTPFAASFAFVESVPASTSGLSIHGFHKQPGFAVF